MVGGNISGVARSSLVIRFSYLYSRLWQTSPAHGNHLGFASFVSANCVLTGNAIFDLANSSVTRHRLAIYCTVNLCEDLSSLRFRGHLLINALLSHMIFVTMGAIIYIILPLQVVDNSFFCCSKIGKPVIHFKLTLLPRQRFTWQCDTHQPDTRTGGLLEGS